MVVLRTWDQEYGLSKNERLLFAQVARTQYLVGIDFQMLADDHLTTEEWKKIRVFAKDSVDIIADRALADYGSRGSVSS